MKLHLIAPALVFVGLVACSKETSAPVSPTIAAEQPAPATAPPADSLSQLPDQLTAEEIQARREAWVSGGSASSSAASSGSAPDSTASSDDAAASRVAAAPAPASRE